MGNRSTPNLDAAEAEVEATESVEDAILIFIDNLQKDLADAIAAQDPAVLQEMADGLKTRREKFAALLTANTPAAGDGSTGSGPGGAADPNAGGTGAAGDGSTAGEAGQV